MREAKDLLSEHVADAKRAHHCVVTSRHGHPAAVLISPEHRAGLEKAVGIRTTPGRAGGGRRDLTDLKAGRIADNDALRARFTRK